MVHREILSWHRRAAALLLLFLSAANASPPESGSIRGVVVNATQGDRPVSGATVVLRVKLDDQFVVAAETASDDEGRFLIEGLPADHDYVYLPGANRSGVHYPGPRLRLSGGHPHANVILKVHDTITGPNPLHVRRHDVVIRPEPRALRVTETMSIENPRRATYVGRDSRSDGRSATLALAIPADFVRTTFHEEFFGRRFTLIDGELVTDVPWTPGIRQLRFTYVLPTTERRRVWERPVDLPTSNLRITVISDEPGGLVCNLSEPVDERPGEVVFAATTTLSRGEVVRLELGDLPIPWMTYARWLALLVVAALIGGTSAVLWRRRRPAIPAE